MTRPVSNLTTTYLLYTSILLPRNWQARVIWIDTIAEPFYCLSIPRSMALQWKYTGHEIFEFRIYYPKVNLAGVCSDDSAEHEIFRQAVAVCRPILYCEHRVAAYWWLKLSTSNIRVHSFLVGEWSQICSLSA